MRIVFLILFIFIIKLSGLCQSTQFFRTYDWGSTSYPVLNMLIEINKSIYVNGGISDINSNKLVLLKTSNTGTVIDTAHFGKDSSGISIENFIILPDSDLLVLTQQIDLSGIYRQYMLYVDTNLAKYNDSLYSLYNSQFFGNCRINNRYYFTGPTWYDDYGDSLPQPNIRFWKTNTNFDTISTKSIGTVNPDLAWTITVGFDNNLLLGGLSLPDGSHQKWYLVNTDTTGQVFGQYFYGTIDQSDNDGIKTISLSSDSCYFLSGIFYQYDFGIGHYYWASSVVKLDRQFNTLWTKKIGREMLGVLVAKMVATSDNNQVILTQRVPDLTPSHFYSQVTKFNNDGNILWSRNYLRGDTTQYVRYRAWDIIETGDKGFAFCGSAIDTTNMGPNQEAWLVKTDSLGCDGLQSCNDTALVCEILNAPDTTCKNDTAWLQVRFKGRSAPYYVFANTTLALDSVYYPYTLPLWIDTLVPYVPHDTDLQQVIVKVKDPWGWYNTDTVQIFVKNCGTGNIQETWYPKKVEIFPNPATTELHVKLRTPLTEPATITINDMQGKAVKQITTKNNETVIGISDLEQGVYGIRVIGNNINASERFVKL